MNELSKTLTFVVVAVVVALAAYFLQPTQSFQKPSDVIGQELVKPFDPLAVTSLEIVEYDAKKGQVHPFKVEQVEVKGKPRWSIPSHDNYPADAKDQVAQAAASLMGLTILGVAGDAEEDQETYGVRDPNPEKLPPGAKGVGTRVTLRDKSGRSLLALIIGKEVKNQPGQRYVRLAGKPSIYTVAVKTDSLSTDFDRWIEKDLLQLNPWDLEKIWIHDYSLDPINGLLHERSEMCLKYNDTGNPRWKLVEDREFNKEGKWQAMKLTDDEELNQAKLDEMKTALDDLKIVDVAPKPAGLSADLKAAKDITQKEKWIVALAQRGFYLAQVSKDRGPELLSNDGEVRSTMKDGVVYVLRFGGIALTSTMLSKKDEKAPENKKAESPSGMNRYLFVMAEFDPQAIEKPKYEPLPEVPAAAKAAPNEKTPAKPPEEKKTAEKADQNATEKKPSAPPAAEKDAPAKIPALDLKALKAETERIKKENRRKEDEYDEKIEKGKKHVEELNHRFADWYYIISDAEYRKIHLGRDDVIKKKEKKEELKDAGKTPGVKQTPGPAKKSAGK